jgi:hypothetical protein
LRHNVGVNNTKMVNTSSLPKSIAAEHTQVIEAWLLGHSVPYEPRGVPLRQDAGAKPSIASGGS